MAGAHLDAALRQIQRLFDSDATDEQLLERFRQSHDEPAFASLLRRYGPMVLRVCGRALGARADIEDAFQATFLLLARKAGEIRSPGSVASWLHGTAYRLSVQMRRQDTRRREKELHAPPPSGRLPEPGAQAAWHELQEVLDEELARLPEKYRAPLVLCYLEGLTHEEAAAQLGWPLGTVRGNVARGREALRQALERRGLTCSNLALGVSLAAFALPQTLPPGLLAGTLSASLRYAAGTSASALVSARAAALIEGANGMLKLKLSLAAAFLLGVGIFALAATSYRVEDKADEQPRKGPPAVAATDSLGDELPPGARLRLGTARLHPGSAGQAAPAFSADGKLLACIPASGGVVIWSVKDGKRIRTLPKLDEAGFSPGAAGTAFSPDASLLYITQSSARIVARDTKTGKVVKTFGGADATTQPFNAFALSRDGKHLAAGGTDGLVAVWADDGTRAKGFKGHKEPVRAVAWSPDGKHLATGGGDGTTRLWDAATGKELRQFPENRGDVIGLAFSADGKELACLGTDDVLRLFDVKTAREKAAGPCPPSRGGRFGRVELAFTADGKRLVVAGSRHLLDIASQKLVPAPWPAGGDFARQAVSPDGKLVATAQGQARIEVHDVATGKPLHAFASHAGQVTAAAWSSKGLIATGGSDRLIRLWDARDGKPVRIIKGHLGTVAALAFSPDGKVLASGGSQFNDQGVSLWDVATGKQLRYVRGSRSGASALSFSPDGKELLAQSSFGATVIRDAATGKVLRELRTGPLQALAASPDGKLLAHPAGGFPPTKLEVRGRSGERVKDIEIGGEVNDRSFISGLAFSPDSKMLVLTTSNGQLSVYDVERGARVRKGPEATVSAPRFQARGPVVRGDGRVAVHVDATGRVRVVELASGKERLSFDSTHGGVMALAMSPDGRSMITAGNDGTALVWGLWGLPAAAPVKAVTEKQLDAAWEALAGDDAVKAGRAVRVLAQSAKEAVPYLAKKLVAEKPADLTKLGGLVGQLDSDDFKTRKKAEAELAKAGERARAALEAALKKKPSLDASKRIKALLERLGSGSALPEDLARIRGVEVLEAAATDEAKALLEKLARSGKGGLLQTEAAASLARLKH